MMTAEWPWVKGFVVAGSWGGGSDVEAGFLVSAVGLAVEDEFVGSGMEPVDGGLGEEGVVHLADPLDGSRFEVKTVEAARWRSTMSSSMWAVSRGSRGCSTKSSRVDRSTRDDWCLSDEMWPLGLFGGPTIGRWPRCGVGAG
jgi:hypothetical protein